MSGVKGQGSGVSDDGGMPDRLIWVDSGRVGGTCCLPHRLIYERRLDDQR